MKTELFEPVLAWLDAGAPHTNDKGLVFNMSYVVAPHKYDYSDQHCGTACCIAGALIQFNDLDVNPYLGHSIAANKVADVVGMTDEQIENLFYAKNRPNGLTSDITPAEAAAAIRSMLETGEVQW